MMLNLELRKLLDKLTWVLCCLHLRLSDLLPLRAKTTNKACLLFPLLSARPPAQIPNLKLEPVIYLKYPKRLVFL
jgi:hypothetical protein